MQFGFSFWGILVFALPMLINIVYAVLPPAEGAAQAPCPYPWVERVEQITRILYLFLLCLIVSNKAVDFYSPWLYAAAVFLLLYYLVWIRYFAGGRATALMSRPFLFVPMPLAVFPVLYFICAALWLHNPPAVVCMVIFGIAHNIVSYAAFR